MCAYSLHWKPLTSLNIHLSPSYNVGYPWKLHAPSLSRENQGNPLPFKDDSGYSVNSLSLPRFPWQESDSTGSPLASREHRRPATGYVMLGVSYGVTRPITSCRVALYASVGNPWNRARNGHRVCCRWVSPLSHSPGPWLGWSPEACRCFAELQTTRVVPELCAEFLAVNKARLTRRCSPWLHGG